jgi:hypothetical protein
MNYIIKERMKEMNSKELVKYYMSLYRDVFNKNYIVVSWGKEGMLMQRIRNAFHKRGKGTLEIAEFFKWGLERHKNFYKNGNRATLGIVYEYLEDYLKEKGWEECSLVSRKVNDEDLDEEMKEWLKKVREKK